MVLITVAHATMVMVMAMTPLHMHHDGMSLEVVGIVISAHILGMYALSPVFGWLADRYGALRVAIGGLGIFAAAIALGLVAAAGGGLAVTMSALVLLGLGWSASLIASSAMLAGVDSGSVRVPLQGATDALMNYAGAGAAAVAGPVLALDGFRGVNLVASVPARARRRPGRRRRAPSRPRRGGRGARRRRGRCPPPSGTPTPIGRRPPPPATTGCGPGRTDPGSPGGISQNRL